MGTPKSLEAAIANALATQRLQGLDEEQLQKEIKAHVVDYLSQQFCKAMFDDWSIKKLWNLLIGKE